MLRNILKKGNLFRSCFSTQKVEGLKKYSQKISKSRAVMPMYSLQPGIFGQIFVAPNATLIGQIYLGDQVYVGHGTVIRGDINAVEIYCNVHIGNNCVLHTAASTSTGLQAKLIIRDDIIIQSGCTLYSCEIRRGAFIGHNSVILEGAYIDEGAIIAPNSVVPPGRHIKARQVWGGNPIKYIRKAKERQAFITEDYARILYESTFFYKEAFIPYNNAYLYKPSSPEDIDTARGKEYQPNKLKEQMANKYDPENTTWN